MTQAEFYNEAFLGNKRLPTENMRKLPLDVRKVIARRAAFELSPGEVINLGLGIPELVADVARDEGIFEDITLTLDNGVVGGIPAARTAFGASFNPAAFLDTPAIFDMYDSGFPATFVGFAECDEGGSVNSSLFVDSAGVEHRPGSGGFVNLTQGARNVIFCGTMTAEGFKAEVGGGKLRIISEGKKKKFVKGVRQITFSGPRAIADGKRVLYVTERCVMELTKDGLLLTEIAEGIDPERDIFAQMDFRPAVSENIKTMNPALFLEGVMGLRKYFEKKSL